MGTLFCQQPRNYRLVSVEQITTVIRDFQEVAKRCKVSVEVVVDIAQLLEKRRELDLTTADRDAKDEQLAGFGELALSLIDAVTDK